jgi:hypothetical protein
MQQKEKASSAQKGCKREPENRVIEVKDQEGLFRIFWLYSYALGRPRAKKARCGHIHPNASHTVSHKAH